MQNMTKNMTKTSRSFASLTAQRFFVLLLPALMAGCNYNDLKNVPAPTGKTGQPNPALVVDFATVKSQVLDPACIRCHSGANPRGGIRLETFEQVFALKDSLRVQVETGAMPPRPPGLSPDQKALVLAWVDSGAPERTVITPPPSGPVTSDPSSPLPPVSSVPSFLEVSSRVFSPHCVKCHNNTDDKGGVNLEDFGSAKKHAREIAFTLDTDDMPRRAPPLSPELKAIVYAWIDGGTPN